MEAPSQAQITTEDKQTLTVLVTGANRYVRAHPLQKRRLVLMLHTAVLDLPFAVV